MRDPEYLLLKTMLNSNRCLFKKGDIEFPEYLENHLLIMNKLKKSIIKMEENDYNFLKNIETDKSIEKFRKGIHIVRYNLN
ncbi:hypothetical protein SAMN02787073_1578 [Chryseobacterium vrystaatense]|uniref:Uncharacterized protein n=1 Tax=Chryseobacterium vrystaatense TaxID=307480 RepID=A0A1M4ZFH6_9FLAO|nr:hypothetical protein SAMN02787073_1578 [Chryseobacterium vrystaatense]